MSFADRVERELDDYEQRMVAAHAAGEHAAEPVPDCGPCVREGREALNVEGDPAFNGAFR